VWASYDLAETVTRFFAKHITIPTQNFLEEKRNMRVGLLTGGGDCPGLNAVIHAVVKKGIFHYGDEFVGFLEGWRGVLDNNKIPLTLQ
jgi:hypothetical protein